MHYANLKPGEMSTASVYFNLVYILIYATVFFGLLGSGDNKVSISILLALKNNIHTKK